VVYCKLCVSFEAAFYVFRHIFGAGMVAAGVSGAVFAQTSHCIYVKKVARTVKKTNKYRRQAEEAAYGIAYLGTHLVYGG